MKIISFICIAIGLFFATTAMALTPHTTFMVKLSTVSPSGQLTQAATMPGTSDANGKISFHFANAPTNSTARFLMVQIADINGAIVRQAMVAAPAPGGTVNMGVSEVTDKQAKAMLKTIADAGSDNPTPMMLLTSMLRSGAISDSDAEAFSPLARAAAGAFETFMTAKGVTATQMATFRVNMLTAMRDVAAKYWDTVNAATPALAADQRGEAIAAFMDAMVDAAIDAGIAANLMPLALDEAAKAAESAAANAPLDTNVIMAMRAIFRVETEQRRLKAEMGSYETAMTTMGATATQAQQLSSAIKALGNAMMSAQVNFEQMFVDPANFPNAAAISAAESSMFTAMQVMSANFTATDAAASNSEITGMLNTMATRISNTGGAMSGMTTTALSGMGIGRMTSAPGGLQNWTVMMTAANNFVTADSPLTYTPSTTLTGQLTALGGTPPTPPAFSQLVDPYKALLELQYDLMLLKLINARKLAQLGATPTQEQLAQLKEETLAMTAALKQNLSGITDAQKDLLVTLSSPFGMM